MRFIRQFGNNIKEAFQGIARNKGMSLLSIISTTAVLVLFGVVLLLVLNMTGLVNETEKKVDKVVVLSLIHISEPTRQCCTSRMPSSA